MKIFIISPGKAHDETVAQGILEYQTRLRTTLPIEWAFPLVGTKEEESKAILKLIKEGDYIVLLDERGKDIDTPTFAEFIDKQMQAGTKRLVFIIGGAFGVADDIAARAQATYKLSSLVFPHMLVRLILVEQLYRVSSILKGGKYHHV